MPTRASLGKFTVPANRTMVPRACAPRSAKARVSGLQRGERVEVVEQARDTRVVERDLEGRAELEMEVRDRAFRVPGDPRLPDQLAAGHLLADLDALRRQ